MNEPHRIKAIYTKYSGKCVIETCRSGIATYPYLEQEALFGISQQKNLCAELALLEQVPEGTEHLTIRAFRGRCLCLVPVGEAFREAGARLLVAHEPNHGRRSQGNHRERWLGLPSSPRNERKRVDG